MSKINLLIIGAGYHSRRIYIPYLLKNNRVNLSAILDLPSQQRTIDDYLSENKISIPTYFTAEETISDDLSQDENSYLCKIVADNAINAVIISTEPLAHFKYAKWALLNSIHILMDKPITTEIEVSTNEKKAEKLYNDYLRLKDIYTKAKDSLVFTLQAQRRFHPGYRKARDLIIEITNKTNCPVTSIESFHSDGMWRLPKEIVEMNYHPYNQGYGKVSHSGYHSIDIALWLAKASITDPTKQYNQFSLYTSFLRPIDFFHQITFQDYKKVFPNNDNSLLLTKEDIEINESFYEKYISGELDAHTILSLKKDGKIMTQIGSHLVHNGFSQRGWFQSNLKDLYKGNGRLRHESYTIEQGPFQCIIINAFQSLEIKNELNNPYSVGGEHHFDIHIFRNSSLYKEYEPYELITMQDLRIIDDIGYSRGHQEVARRDCVDEFIQAIENHIPRQKQESNFLNHEFSTFVLSKIYASSSKEFHGKNPISKGMLPEDIWKS